MIKITISLLASVLAIVSVAAAPLPMSAGVDNAASMKASCRAECSGLYQHPFHRIPGRTELMRPMFSPGISGTGDFMRVVSPSATISARNMARATRASRAMAPGTDLRGNVIQMAGWTDETAQPGIYKVPFTDEMDFALCGAAELNGGGYDDGEGTYRGVYYFQMWSSYYVYVRAYNSKTWERTASMSGASISIACTDNAMDPITGEVYGCYFNNYGTGYVWAKADYDAGKSTKIADIAVPSKTLIAVGCDKEGQFYAISKEAVLYKVEKTTGELTEIAQTEVPVQYLAGGCIDDNNNTFLVSYATSSSTGLCEVDLATGVTTLLTEFPTATNVIGLHLYHPAAADGAPDKPGLSVSCPEGKMTVDYTVTMPVTLFDGTDASGSIFRWTLKANNEVVTISNLRAGESTSGSVDLTDTGVVDFVLTCENSAGVSPKAKASCYIGRAVPASPENVVLTFDKSSSVATMTWDAVTRGADEGWFEAEDVTYRVMDMEGNVMADRLEGTSWSRTIAVPENWTIFRYKVEALHGGKSSAAALSNKIGLGSVSVPYSHDFEVAESFDDYIVLDANKDGSTWVWSNQSATGPCACYVVSDQDADDWLFTPAYRLEEGKIYELTAMVGSFSTWAGIETLEVRGGRGADPAAMDMEIIAPTDLEWQTVEPLSGWIRPTETGLYTVGFHAVSKANQWMMKMNSFSISEAMTEASPDKPSDVSIVPDADGRLYADISFRAPGRTVLDEHFSGNVTVTVYRDGELLRSFPTKSGMLCRFVDELPVKGSYVYRFVSSRGVSTGRYCEATAYVGPNAPVNPEDVRIVEAPVNGSVTLSWDAVDKDIYGNTILASNLSYNIWMLDGKNETWNKVNDTPVTSMSYTFTALDSDEPQRFLQTKVTALNLDEENPEGTASRMIAVGEPYLLPARLSGDSSMFTDYILGADNSAGGSIGIADSETGVPAFDGDDAFFAISGGNLDDAATIITGKFDLGEADHPILSMQSFKIAADDVNEIKVGVFSGGEYTEVLSTDRSSLTPGQWNKIKVDLSAYAGRQVQIYLTGVIKAYTLTLIDDIRIEDDVDNDVVAVSLAAPSVVRNGEQFQVDVCLFNDGALTAENFAVDLYADSKIVETREIRSLDAAGMMVVNFETRLTPVSPQVVSFQGAVRFNLDERPDNNVTGEVSVTRDLSSFPIVATLRGEISQEGNLLTWDAIDGTNLPADPELTDFEDAESWADGYAGWTFVDMDQQPIGGMQDTEIPGHPHGSQASFWIFDSSDETLWNKTFRARSGNKFLASMFNYDDSQVDDWAISPELDGAAQILTFYAHSYSPLYAEQIEVWYCTSTSVEPTDFVRLESFGTVTVPSGYDADDLPVWGEMRCLLPEGALRFAVRTVAAGGFMLMLDDFSFARAGGISTLEHAGYNLYRDGECVNASPLTETSFLDKDGVDGASHSYHVSAIYNRGESEVSNEVLLENSGIDEALATSVSVTASKGVIHVRGVADEVCTVTTVDGKLLYTGTGDFTLPVPPAVYLVAVGINVFKLRVP